MPAEPPEGWDAYDEQIRAAEERDRALELERRRQARRQEMIAQGASPRLLDLAGVRTRTPAIIQLAHALAQPDRGQLVVLAGPPGVGKSAAATLWLLHCDTRVWFSTSARFARRSRYGDQPWESARRAVLDDLGVEYVGQRGSFATDFDELLAHYHAHRKRLVITTNLSIDSFTDRYGERVVDRIREAGKWVALDGESMRK